MPPMMPSAQEREDQEQLERFCGQSLEKREMVLRAAADHREGRTFCGQGKDKGKTAKGKGKDKGKDKGKGKGKDKGKGQDKGKGKYKGKGKDKGKGKAKGKGAWTGLVAGVVLTTAQPTPLVSRF